MQRNEVSSSVRYRINVERGQKGGYKFECTVETEGCTMVQALAESNALVAELKALYPATTDRKEGE